MFRTPDGQYMRVRVDGVPYRVEEVVDIAPADPDEDECPEGWLKATVEAYSEERDETVELAFVMPPTDDDPTKPDFQGLARISRHE